MKRQRIKDQTLAELEREFRPLLIACLQECQKGRWGLFGQNDGREAERYLAWKEGKRLKEIAQQIRALRAEFGQPDPLVESYLHTCSLRGPNVPGEPKLAKALLERIRAGGFELPTLS